MRDGQKLLGRLGNTLGLGDPELRQRLLDCAQARVELGDPARQLAQVADELAADLVVVGSRGRGRVNALVLGSVSQALAAAPSRPVLIVPPTAHADYDPRNHEHAAKSIVCGVDGSASSLGAADVAGWLCEALDLRLVLAHVDPEGESLAPGSIGFSHRLRTETRKRLRLLHRALPDDSDPDVAVSLARGEPAAAIGQLAVKERAAMIAVGTRGHGELRALAAGSVSRSLGARGPCPVLVVSEGTRPPARARMRRATTAGARP